MTNVQWDKLFAEIMASLDRLKASVAQANGDSSREARLFKQLSAVQAQIESLTRQCLGDSTAPPKLQPGEYPDENLRRKWKEESRLTPELRQWALQLFSEEEILAGLREIEETGGLELSDFIHELDEIVNRP